MKSYFCTAALSVCAVLTFAAPSFAEQTSPWSSSGNQTVHKSVDSVLNQSMRPGTGNQWELLGWNGMGKDTAQHPDGPLHNPVTCGICK